MPTFRLRLDGLDRPSGRITATVLLSDAGDWANLLAVVTAPRINTANAVALRSSRRTIFPPFEHAPPTSRPTVVSTDLIANLQRDSPVTRSDGGLRYDDRFV